jgi:hypothetical protein
MFPRGIRVLNVHYNHFRGNYSIGDAIPLLNQVRPYYKMPPKSISETYRHKSPTQSITLTNRTKMEPSTTVFT